MKQLPSRAARPLIRFAYLLPLLVAVALLILAAAPHIFYMFDGDPRESKSLFELMADTWDFCNKQLDGAFETTPDTMYFPYIMMSYIVVSWIIILLYAIVSVAASLCSLIAFSYPPASKNANLAKRWLHFFCPNRGTYVIIQLLPILPAFFPPILEHFQRTMFAMNLTIHYELSVPDWLAVSVPLLVSIVLWLCLLPAQRDEHMDMYRLEKTKK